jgi:type II secretory pathway predicted ATPase ExeA
MLSCTFVDEAHLLDRTTLEDIRLLTNTDFDRAAAVTIVFLGQLSLRGRVKTPGFEALNQRLRYRYAMEGFTEEETAAYIKHRLQLSGWNQEFFAPQAIRHIFLVSPQAAPGRHERVRHPLATSKQEAVPTAYPAVSLRHCSLRYPF